MKISSLRIAADAGLLNAGEYDPSKDVLPVTVLTEWRNSKQIDSYLYYEDRT
jgi:hypothetical protein